MSKNAVPSLIALCACAGLCSSVAAQPKMIITGIAGDLAAAGDGAVGLVSVGLNSPSSQFTTPAITWSRLTGYTMIPGATRRGTDGVRCSDDLSVLAMSTNNTTDWGLLNCFAGYNTTTGLPNPEPTPPCAPVGISHRWTAATGWVNLGSFPRFPDPVTGRLIGGTKCDFDISSPKDISGDGRFVLCNGWYARAFNGGGISSGFCGNFFGYTYDAVGGTITQLPVQPGTTTSRADVINFDGSVITGYDLDSPNSTRRLCVWRDGVQTILDPFLGSKDNAAISGPGAYVATGASPDFVAATFPGETGVRLVRWMWDGAAWVPDNLGKPADYVDPNIGVPIPCGNIWGTGMSDDGRTILGMAEYGPPPPSTGGIRRPFIWRPGLNNGVPMDLEAYVASIGNPNDPIFPTGLTATYAGSLSSDGNAVLVQLRDQRNTCTFPGRSHVTFNAGVIYLDGSTIACSPPRIGVGPESWTDWSGLGFGVSLNVVASGSWPLSYQWQREDPGNPGSWINLAESCQNFDPQINWDYEGVYKNQLRIGVGNLGGGRGGRYRVVVSNSCGSVASDPATVTFQTGACCIPSTPCVQDFLYPCQANGGTFSGPGTLCASSCEACYANCDGSVVPPVLNVSDFICFQTKYAAGDPYANCDGSTVPPILNVSDFICFQTRYSAGCS